MRDRLPARSTSGLGQACHGAVAPRDQTLLARRARRRDSSNNWAPRHGGRLGKGGEHQEQGSLHEAQGQPVQPKDKMESLRLERTVHYERLACRGVTRRAIQNQALLTLLLSVDLTKEISEQPSARRTSGLSATVANSQVASWSTLRQHGQARRCIRKLASISVSGQVGTATAKQSQFGARSVDLWQYNDGGARNYKCHFLLHNACSWQMLIRGFAQDLVFLRRLCKLLSALSMRCRLCFNERCRCSSALHL